MLKEKIKEYKKELVLQKAGEYLEQKGFKEAKMADIAKHCGISVGALYKLFASKDELFYEYVRYQVALFYNRLQMRFEFLQTPQERIKEFIKLKFELFMEKKALLKDTLAGDPLFFVKLSANKENPAKMVYELLAKELEKLGLSNPRKLSYLLNYYTYGYIEYWLIYDTNLVEFVDEAYTLFMDGAKNV